MVLGYNYQILEYLGDSFLNFTVSKLFYLETALQTHQWHSYYFNAQKLHDLKTWFTSNQWLAYIIYENFFFTILTSTSDQQKKSFQQLVIEIKSFKDEPSQNPKLKELLKRAPRFPLLYDEQNTKYDKQIQEFQQLVFKLCCFQCQDKYLQVSSEQPQEQIAKALSMSSFTESEVKDEDEDDIFYQIQENYVKFFSDSLEALIGAVFLESCDFEKAQLITLRLMNTNLIDSFPVKEQQRTKVIAIWNSKKYTTGIKLSHSIEEKEDQVYIRGFMNQMEVRRVKFSKDKKKKVPKFYADFQQYLEETYYKFEESTIKKSGSEIGPVQYLEFNKDYRKAFKSSKSNKVAEGSIIKEACRRLYVHYKNQGQKQLDIAYIKNIKDELIQFLNEGFIDAKYDEKQIPFQLLLLEKERVKSSKIREFFLQCEIKSINTTAKGVRTFEDFITRLPDKQNYYLYFRMFQLAEQMIEQNKKEKELEEKAQIGKEKTELALESQQLNNDCMKEIQANKIVESLSQATTGDLITQSSRGQ